MFRRFHLRYHMCFASLEQKLLDMQPGDSQSKKNNQLLKKLLSEDDENQVQVVSR